MFDVVLLTANVFPVPGDSYSMTVNGFATYKIRTHISRVNVGRLDRQPASA